MGACVEFYHFFNKNFTVDIKAYPKMEKKKIVI